MEVSKKYKLTDDYKFYNGQTLYRIQALKDFGRVHNGDRGGFVHSEENLSQEGYCWITDNAIVCDNAVVCDDAVIYDNAVVCGNSLIKGHSVIMNHSLISDSQVINAVTRDYAKITDGACIRDYSVIGGEAQVSNKVVVSNSTTLKGTTQIKHQNDFITFQLWWEPSASITYVFQNETWFTFTNEYHTNNLLYLDYEGTHYNYIKALIEMAQIASKASGPKVFNDVIDQIENATKTFLSDSKLSVIYDDIDLQVVIEFDKEYLYKSNDINMLETALKDVRRTLNVQSLYNIPFIKSVEMKLWKKDN